MKSVRAYQGAYGVILEDYALGEAQLYRDQVFLAEADGDILGFYSLIVGGEPELDLMFVADAAQGHMGLRHFLLFDHAARDSAGARHRIRLDCVTSAVR